MSHAHEQAHVHGSLKSYIVGFILSVVLTVIPFWLVMHGSLSHTATISTIVLLAVAQLVVQLVYFLHMNTSAEGRWDLGAFLFSLLVIGILVGGSLWIMHNANELMMPMPHDSAAAAVSQVTD